MIDFRHDLKSGFKFGPKTSIKSRCIKNNMKTKQPREHLLSKGRFLENCAQLLCPTFNCFFLFLKVCHFLMLNLKKQSKIWTQFLRNRPRFKFTYTIVLSIASKSTWVAVKFLLFEFVGVLFIADLMLNEGVWLKLEG